MGQLDKVNSIKACQYKIIGADIGFASPIYLRILMEKVDIGNMERACAPAPLMCLSPTLLFESVDF